ncbi:hypothetical protein BXO92_05870 [Escherichia coli]|nr:hypothetical protein BXO92_05870 [Escherichia coli]OOC70491.1 hypothetical protein BWP21_18380 [Escherichia coli]TFA42544.1 hypothetical protein BON90_07485 [Escherichia coli]TFA44834.1 hypothetical protein BON91_03515 [Escherichia coli]
MVTPDATLDASYPAWGIAHVGRIRRLRRIRQPLLITAYEKNRYTTYTNARHSRRNLVRLAARQ